MYVKRNSGVTTYYEVTPWYKKDNPEYLVVPLWRYDRPGNQIDSVWVRSVRTGGTQAWNFDVFVTLFDNYPIPE